MSSKDVNALRCGWLVAGCVASVCAFSQNETLNETHWREQRRANVSSYPYFLPEIRTVHGDLRRPLGDVHPAMPGPRWFSELMVHYRTLEDRWGGASAWVSSHPRLLVSGQPLEDVDVRAIEWRRRHVGAVEWRQSTPWGLVLEAVVPAQGVRREHDAGGGLHVAADERMDWVLSDTVGRVMIPIMTERYHAVSVVFGTSVSWPAFEGAVGIPLDDPLTQSGGVMYRAGARWSSAWSQLTWLSDVEAGWCPDGQLAYRWTEAQQRQLELVTGDAVPSRLAWDADMRWAKAGAAATWRWGRRFRTGIWTQYERWESRSETDEVGINAAAQLRVDELRMERWHAGLACEITVVPGLHVQVLYGVDPRHHLLSADGALAAASMVYQW